ncbi:MAG: PDGLE domain-containing protein [Rhodospirillales bacterium]|nr:PDGLE domain-containing protein [Rhodospirillales bacterium]
MNPRLRLLLVGIVLAIVVAAFASFAASPEPDGLERVAENLGFLDRAQDAPYQMLPDYTIPGLGEGPLSTAVAGVVGILVVAAIAVGAGNLLHRRREQ